ncbi:hypothetical protein WJX81_007101 [Elliptochloris bilobata]|uniref:Isochorismatase-like domain-containing protein n=1 Tax=Elliptochloris bilobata TaxID=381761 RepID=A0AAW1SDY8_9CHLO
MQRISSAADGRSFAEILIDCFRNQYLGPGVPALAPSAPQTAYCKPQRHLREAALVPRDSALLFVDVQNYNCSLQGAINMASCQRVGEQAPGTEYWWRALEAAEARWKRLRAACKRAGIEVIYTVMQSLTADGRDRSLDYKISGFHVPPGSFDAQVLECVAPGEDDIVLPKTSSSVFISTNLDYLLRCLGKRQVVVVGALTDQCVEGAVRDACDLQYLVTLVTDACVTMSSERQEASLRAIGGYCRQRTTEQLLAELAPAAAAGS